MWQRKINFQESRMETTSQSNYELTPEGTTVYFPSSLVAQENSLKVLEIVTKPEANTGQRKTREVEALNKRENQRQVSAWTFALELISPSNKNTTFNFNGEVFSLTSEGNTITVSEVSDDANINNALAFISQIDLKEKTHEKFSLLTLKGTNNYEHSLPTGVH